MNNDVRPILLDESGNDGGTELMQFILTKTETWTATYINLDWMPMSPQYREIRAKAKNKLCSCIRCGWKFSDGEMMSLAQFEGRANNVLCRRCADYLLSKGNTSDGETTEGKNDDAERTATGDAGPDS